MGANKKTTINTIKCGDIFTNLKSTHKSRMFIFSCALCDVSCDQLKKFSHHLEEVHSKLKDIDDDVLSEEDGEDKYEDAIPQRNEDTTSIGDIKENMEHFLDEITKIEEPVVTTYSNEHEEKEVGAPFQTYNTEEDVNFLENKNIILTEDVKQNMEELLLDIKIEENQVNDCNKVKNLIPLEVESTDPLETTKGVKTRSDTNKKTFPPDVEMKVEINSEDDEGDAYRNSSSESDDNNEFKCESDTQDSSDDSSSHSEYGEKKSIKNKRRKIKKSLTSKKVEQQQDIKTKRRRPRRSKIICNIDEKELTLAIIAALQKRPILWDVKTRTHDANLREKEFQEITNEINEQFKLDMRSADIRKRIKDIRSGSALEYDKKSKGEQYQLPWYNEHIHFLKENIEVLIKNQFFKKTYAPINSLKESEISMFIEYYRKHNALWQVDNISFVIKSHRQEALESIVKELKEIHNIDFTTGRLKQHFKYINRLYSTEKEQQLKCEMENKKFIPSCKYYNDLQFLSESQGPFKCSYCNQIIQKYDLYQIHLAKHTEQIPFKCPLCDVRSRDIYQYRKHATGHFEITTTYECNMCGKKFIRRYEYHRHLKQHTNPYPFLCELCGQGFRFYASYTAHKLRHENRVLYRCHICQRGYSHKPSLESHIKVHLNVRDIICKICGKGFTNKNNLSRHLDIHSEVKRFKCLVCGKAFAQDTGLRAHRKQHPNYNVIAKQMANNGTEKHSKFCDTDDTDPIIEECPDNKPDEKYEVSNETPTKEDIKENLEIFVPEIKVEELMDITNGEEEDEDEDYKKMKLPSTAKSEDENQDPLETSTKCLTISIKSSTDADIKNVKGEDGIEHDEDYAEDADNNYEFNCELDYEDSAGDSGSESDQSEKKAEITKNKLRKRKPTRNKESGTEDDTDDSQDMDFNMEKEKAKNKVGRKKSKKTNNNPPVDEKELTLAVLAALEKQPVLWDIKNRSHDKIIRQNGFQEIAKEVNEKLQLHMKWEDIRKRITDIRYQYSREYDKQLKGEKCELPWYTEHMKFLKENIEVLIKHRYQKKKYRRLSSLEESHIPIIIEYYKKCEVLWQVNNIGFVVKPKKLEALKPIIQELKEKHNIDISIQDMQRRIDYINRIYSADKEQQLKCEMENKEFVPSSKYYEELTFLNESQGPFKCSHCNEIIAKYESYHIHLSEHTKQVPFKCALCEMRFNKLVKYIVHAKRHLHINNYHCDVCGKGYPFRAELEWHVREHTGEEPYLCEICGASFRSRHGYDNHIRRHEKRFRYECHICKYGFNHLHALNAHVKAHLNIRDILCNVCGKGFTAKKHLLRHQQIHSDTKRYKCLVCGKAFAQDAGLRAHRKQHADYDAIAKLTKKDFRRGRYVSFTELGEQNIDDCGNNLDADVDDQSFYDPDTNMFTDNDDVFDMDEKEKEPVTEVSSDKEVQEDCDEEYEIEDSNSNDSDEEDPIKDNGTKNFRITFKRNQYKINFKTTKNDVVRDFFKSRPKLLTFIASYKNQPDLWDIPVNAQVSAEQRVKCQEQIAKEIEENHEMKLTLDQVRDIISHMRTRHRVAAMNAADYGEDKPKPEWFVELLNFLPCTFNVTLNELGCHDLKKLQIIQILKIYEEYPSLWNSDLVEYVCSNKRDEAFQGMLNTIQTKMKLNIDLEDLKRYIHNINQFCSKEKRLEMRNVDPKNMSEYYKCMEYLRDHVTPFKCAECKKKFVHALTFKIHLNSHGGDGSVKCKICGKSYSTVGPYIWHCRRHMSDLPSECKECGKRFIRDADLRTHMRTHTGAKPFCCEICGQEFRHSNSLVLHKRRHNKEYLFKCPMCPLQFYAKSSLTNHLDSHKEERTHICKICGKAYRTKSTLKNHKLTHETELKHPCQLCGKLFKNRLGIYHHMKTHRRKEQQYDYGKVSMEMYDYDDYIKCGEILLSPSITDKEQFILKCSDCDRYYCELQLFIPHWQRHYNDNESEVEVEEDVLHRTHHKDETKRQYVGKDNVKHEQEIGEDEHQKPLAELGENNITECINEFGAKEETPCSNDPTMINVFVDNDDNYDMEEENSASEHPSEKEIQDDCDEEYEVEEYDVEDSNKDDSGEEEKDPIKDSKDLMSKLQRNKFKVKLKNYNKFSLREFFTSRTKVLTFITSYKNLPILWDVGVSGQLSTQQRVQYLEQIAKEFDEKHNTKLTLDQIREIISHMRTRHRVAAKNEIDYGENKPKAEWFVDLLNFLPSCTFNATLNELGSHNLKKPQIKQLLRIYEQFPNLWNSDLVEYVCHNKRQEALQEMLDVIKTSLKLNIELGDLKRYINDINQFCSKEKSFEMRNVDPKNMSEYYQCMEYLRDHVTPFKCIECKKEFFHSIKFKMHVNSHDGDGCVKCKICGKPYSSLGTYLQHCRRHMDDLPIECTECGKRFIRAADLRTHMRTHTGAMPYCCEICGKEFRHSNGLLMHTRRHNKEYAYACSICSRPFYTKTGLNNHMDIHKEERNHICKICGKAFKAKSTLRAHMLTHETDLKHPCELCGKLFKNRIGIYHHMRTHRRKETKQN
ncbi:uncharacterized protein [Musca autumnalis]|uniref:uncharacterized protein n=1 Tax=Musca autumnalis TaxID=221902 RepID=UPI003CED0A01